MHKYFTNFVDSYISTARMRIVIQETCFVHLSISQLLITFPSTRFISMHSDCTNNKYLMILLESCRYYQKVTDTIGKLQILLKSCRYHWKVADIIGKLQILLESCRYYWKVADTVGKLQIILESCRYYWKVADNVGKLQILLESCSYY